MVLNSALLRSQPRVESSSYVRLALPTDFFKQRFADLIMRSNMPPPNQEAFSKLNVHSTWNSANCFFTSGSLSMLDDLIGRL